MRTAFNFILLERHWLTRRNFEVNLVARPLTAEHGSTNRRRIRQPSGDYNELEMREVFLGEGCPLIGDTLGMIRKRELRRSPRLRREHSCPPEPAKSSDYRILFMAYWSFLSSL